MSWREIEADEVKTFASLAEESSKINKSFGQLFNESARNPAILFMREAIVKLFENASRRSWPDNLFIFPIIKPFLPLLLGIKIIPPPIISFSSDSKPVISCLSPLKIFRFKRWDLNSIDALLFDL